ncbi:MAG TPA: hypothetical protein VFC84_05610 [Desulfosporosinus sp.]|nr:hypothetical protein [Desulfosporosinus sp.]
MSKGKEGIKDLKLIGAAMGNMEVASEVGPLNDKVSHQEQAVHSLTSQGRQLSQNQSHQKEPTKSQELLEHLAQLAKEQVIKVKNIFN